MQQSKQSDQTGQKCDVRPKVIDAVVSYVLMHHDWSIPLADSRYFQEALPACSNQRVRALLVQHADEGNMIKVITRELPLSLVVRPPSWIDLREASLFGGACQQRDLQSMPASSAFCRFFPSPVYLKSLSASRFESPLHHSWIVGEAQRIWRELQQEDTRALVKTNVPNERAGVIESLTTKLFNQLGMYPTIRRNDAHVAMLVAAKRVGLAVPLKEGDEREMLRLAREYLMRGRDGHVRDRFEALSRPGWRF